MNVAPDWTSLLEPGRPCVSTQAALRFFRLACAVPSPTPRLVRLIAATALAITGTAAGGFARDSAASRGAVADYSLRTAALVNPVRGPAGSVNHRLLLGHSVDGRPIVAIETGDPSSARK